jgi:hypothetical protein
VEIRSQRFPVLGSIGRTDSRHRQDEKSVLGFILRSSPYALFRSAPGRLHERILSEDRHDGMEMAKVQRDTGR